MDLDKANEANQAKHGVSLSLARELDWKSALVWVDERFEYDELRMIALSIKSGQQYLFSRTVHAVPFACTPFACWYE
ncbi:MAG: BrnT family toxin [Aeromicrobium sp.]|nr:BrnT family toxin [Burkholderiales bacterium]